METQRMLKQCVPGPLLSYIGPGTRLLCDMHMIVSVLVQRLTCAHSCNVSAYTTKVEVTI